MREVPCHRGVEEKSQCEIKTTEKSQTEDLDNITY